MYRQQACIVGVGTSDAFGFSLGRSPLTLQTQALRAALDDSGLARTAIDGVEIGRASCRERV